MAWIPGETIQALGRNLENLSFIKSAVYQGFKPTETYNKFKELGIAGRKQNFLDIFRAFSYSLTNPNVYIPSDSALKPRAEFIPDAVTRQNRPYRAVISVDIYDPDFNVVNRQHVTIDTNTLMSMDEYYQEAVDIATAGYEYFGSAVDWHVESMSFTNDPFYPAFI